MVRGNMMRWGWLVTGAALAMTGCNCDPKPVTCDEAIVTFETPEAGATVDSPFEVRAVAKTADGTAFAFDQASLKIGDRTVDGTVSGNRATFAGVTASPGEVSFTATIAAGSCTKASAAQTVTVRDTCTTAAVTAVTFPQDLDDGGVLNRAELPDMTPLQVRVAASCVGNGEQVRILRGSTVVGGLTPFTNGVAIVSTMLPDSDSARYDLFAELVRNGMPVNTTTGNPAANGSIQVSRALPACAIVTTGTFGPRDDTDPSTPGLQMSVNGTMALTATGTLTVMGQTPVAVTPIGAGEISAPFSFANSGTFAITLTCIDSAGNQNTATGSLTIDFTPPVVSITSPAHVDGGATMAVTQSPLTVRVSTDAEDGATAEVFRNGISVGTGTVANGMVTLQVPFGADGTFTVEVSVEDLAGNKTRTGIVVQVTLDGCGAIFTRPASSPALLTPAQLTNGAYSFQLTSKTTCANQTAQLYRADVLADGGFGAETLASNGSVGASGITNFPAVSLVSGEYRFRGVVQNLGSDAGVSETTSHVLVDLDGPSITNPLVPTGQTFATINVAQDTQTMTCGVQRSLSFSARVPPGGRVDVCTTQATNPCATSSDGGVVTRPTSPECGAGWYVLQQGVSSPVPSFSFPDGTYDVKVVVVGGGVSPSPSSPAVPVLVDSVRPCIDTLTRTILRDANADGRLNIAELGGQQPQVSFRVGCNDSPATLAQVNAVVLRDVVAGTPGAARASTSVFANGAYTSTLEGSYATEVDLNFFIELTDRAGNRNLFVATGDPGLFTFRVDPIAPTCTVASPTASLLGIAQVPGGNLDVIVSTSSDVSTNGVNFTFTGQADRPRSPSLGQAQTTYALTGDNTYTIGATCADQAGNTTTATSRTTRVDLVAPTCNFTAPANNSTSGSNDVTTTVAVTGVSNGDVVTITSSLAGITGNQLAVSGGSASGTVRFPNGTQTVTASVSDAAGNLCEGSARQIQLTVNSASCSLDFAGGTVITNTNGSWINRASAGNAAGTSPVTVSVGAATSDCGAGRNVYLYQGAPSSTPSGTPQVTSASGAVTFAGVSVSEGQQWTITIDNGAGLLTHRSFVVSFGQPGIGSIALQRSSADTTVVPVVANASLTFGASAGNRRVETAVPTDMVFADLDAAMAGAQFQLTLGNVDGARVGSLNGTLEVLEGTTPIGAPISVTSTPFTPSLQRMTLGHRTDETATSLVIRVTSPAGNVFTSTHTSQVDVIAPASPTVTATLANGRAATITLGVTVAYDDGSSASSGGLTGGSPAAGYDVRWTTALVSASGVPDSATYFNSSLVNADSIVAWQATDISQPLSLPPINSYFISVRARDEVGNYSAFVAPTSLANRGTEDVLLNPTNTASQRFAGVMAGPDLRVGPDAGTAGIGYGYGAGIGSVNADSLDDFVVGSPNRAVTADGGVLMPDAGVVASGTSQALAGAVYVYFGRPGFTSSTTCNLPDCQTIVPYQSQASALFGGEASLGNVDTVNTDPTSRVDLVVSSTGYDANRGRVFLYFGNTASASIDTTSFVEFRGQDYGSRLGGAAKVIPDLNGDGLNEILMAARGEPVSGANAGQGFWYLFFGRTRAQWLALMTSTDAVTGRPYVPVTAATASRVLEGPLPVDAVGSVTNLFGATRGVLSSLGDLTGDGVPDFVIAANKNSINVAYLYSGAAVAAASAAIPVPSLRIDELDKGTTGVNNGFGTRVVGGQSIVSSGAPDLIATQARPAGGTPVAAAAATVKLYSNGTSAGYGAPVATITGSTVRLFGGWAEVADVNADGRRDIFVGEAGQAATSAWVFYQRGNRTFDSNAGAGFWQSSFTGPAASRRGASAAYGDFDGDGNLDLAIGDDIDGVGRVIVWH